MVGRSPPLQDVMLSFLGLRLGDGPLSHLRILKIKLASPQVGISTYLPFGRIPPVSWKGGFHSPKHTVLQRKQDQYE